MLAKIQGAGLSIKMLTIVVVFLKHVVDWIFPADIIEVVV